MSKTQIIAVANQKGGVGKTTTTLNLAAALRREGKRVLVIDMDPQGNLTSYLGHNPADGGPAVSDLLMEMIREGALEAEIAAAIRQGAEMEYIPSGSDLAGVVDSLFSADGRDYMMKWVLEAIAENTYDFILMDCLPDLNTLLINCLTAADSVLIPVQAQQLALEGLSTLMNSVKRVRRRLNPALQVTGIVVTMCDNTNMSKYVESELRENYGKLVYETTISRAVEAAVSTQKKISLVEMKGRLGPQYQQLAKEIVEAQCHGG